MGADSTREEGIDGSPRGWYWRGYLPHFDGGEVPQSITFRVTGSLPAEVIESWRERLQRLPPSVASVKLHERVDRYLDSHIDAPLLTDQRVARLMENALLWFDGERYRMHAWTVMPNHVHALATPLPGHSIGQVVHSWKSYVANQANRALGRQGASWHDDFFDRYIRDARHFDAAVSYIEYNPVEAGLCDTAEEWQYGSARRRSDDGEWTA